MRDLAVPYKSTYEYTCTGGTLSIDGALPTGFTFENNTIEYKVSTAPTTSGSFKLKATANDGTGRTKTITITYYGVTAIDENTCRFLYTDGRVSDEQTLSILDGTLSLSLSVDNQKLLKAVYFGELNDVTTIGNNFLYSRRALNSVDLSPLTNVTTIGRYFLSYCYGLTSLDLSPLTSVSSIGTYFLFYCYALTSITVGGTDFTNTTIGNNSMSGVTNLPSNKIYGSKATNFKAQIGTNISS
jgi:hypothetical protein